jgi:hypothetical protein
VTRVGGKIAVVTKNDLEIIPDDLDRVGKTRSRFSTIVREKVRNANPGDVRLYYDDTKARLYIQLGQGIDDLYVAELGVPGAPVWQHKRASGNRLGQSGVTIDASSNPRYLWNLGGGYVYTEPNVIVGELKQGWSDFGQDAMVNAYRVNLESDFSAGVATAIAYDYQSANFTNTIAVTTADPIDEWQAAGGAGRRARFEMVVSVSASATGEFSLTNVDYLITPGGIK